MKFYGGPLVPQSNTEVNFLDRQVVGRAMIPLVDLKGKGHIIMTVSFSGGIRIHGVIL